MVEWGALSVKLGCGIFAYSHLCSSMFLSTIFCKRASHGCPQTSSLAFKLVPCQADHCRQILSLALWRSCMPTIWRCQLIYLMIWCCSDALLRNMGC
eukprot:361389-Chlamydomonas_euryale.AAC.6